MDEVIIRLGNFSVYSLGLLAVFSFLWGSFVFYKKAIESHLDDLAIFDAVVLAAFWGFLGGRLTYVILNPISFWNHWSRMFLLINYPGLDKWGVFLGLALGVFLTTRRIKGKFMDWLDLACLGVSSGMAIFYIGLAGLSFSWKDLLFGFLYLSLFVYFWKMADNYRTLSWYRGKKTSARSGLISGFSISAWGILAVAEEILSPKSGSLMIVWGVILLIWGVVLVYIRSGRTWSDDIKIISKHGRK